MKDSQAGTVLRGGRKVLMEGNCCLRTRGIYVYGGGYRSVYRLFYSPSGEVPRAIAGSGESARDV